MSGHRRWKPPTDERRDEVKEQMAQYVEGYILALTDIRAAISEVSRTTLSTTPWAFPVGRIQEEVSRGLNEARRSLRMWKGTDDIPEEGSGGPARN